MPWWYPQASFVCDRGVFGVICGAGGQGSGGVAVDAVADQLRAALERGGARADAVTKALIRAGAQLRARPVAEGGQTASVVLLIVDGPQDTLVHVGLCAAFRIRGSDIHRLTADHSITPLHSLFTITDRAVGGPDDRVDVTEEIYDAGDRYVLLSEAATAMLSPAEILATTEGHLPQEAAARLVERVHARDPGPRGRATAVVVESARQRERF